jgi:hypothetical protein
VIHDLIVSHLDWKPHITPDVYVVAAIILAGALLSLTATIVSIVGWIRRRVLLNSGTAAVAASGLVVFWMGLAWGEIHYYIEKLHDPPGWIVDRIPYSPPRVLALIGFLMLSIAVIAKVSASAYRRFAWGSASIHRA